MRPLIANSPGMPSVFDITWLWIKPSASMRPGPTTTDVKAVRVRYLWIAAAFCSTRFRKASLSALPFWPSFSANRSNFPGPVTVVASASSKPATKARTSALLALPPEILTLVPLYSSCPLWHAAHPSPTHSPFQGPSVSTVLVRPIARPSGLYFGSAG